MPTTDASQFTSFKKYAAIQDRKITGGPKLVTHLYSHVPNVTQLREFLPNFQKKVTTGVRIRPINFVTGLLSKQRRPPA
jgi:hypothetical protein